MIFLNPILLAGILLVALPIAIHLLNRARFRVEPFGAMLFLRQAMAVKARKLRLRQLFLLLLRCLLLALLAVALARPVMQPRGGAAGRQPTTHIVILDASLSMHQGQGADNAFHRAREQTLQLAMRMDDSDNMQVIWGARKPLPVFSDAVFDTVYLQNRIRYLEPLYEAMDMPGALEQAFWASEASTLPRRRIYVLTDGQGSAWRLDDAAAWNRLDEHFARLSIKPAIYVLEQKPESPVDNLAVAGIALQTPLADTFRESRFACEIRNHGAKTMAAKLRFLVDGHLRAERIMQVQPGRQEALFSHQFKTSGSHYVSVEIGEDGLLADNRLVKAVAVTEKVPVLILEGQTSDNPWQSDGAFLRMALASPATDLEEAGSPFAVIVRPQAEMDACGLDYLRQFRCVALADVVSVSDFFTFALERFIEGGGGLLAAPGNNAVAAVYNRLYKDGHGVLPARLETIVGYGSHYFHPVFLAADAAPFMEAFDLSRPLTMNDVNIASYWRCSPAGDAIVPARLGDDPLLVYRGYGEGRTMLWTAGIGAEWSNLPMTASYLPLVQNLVLFLSAGTQSPVNVRPGAALLFSSGRPLTGGEDAPRMPIPENTVAIVCTVTTPDGEKETMQLASTGQDWTGRWSQTAKPGLYTFSSAYFPDRHFAVQPETEESDLKPLSPLQAEILRNRAIPIIHTASRTGLQSAISKETGMREWWQPLALGVLALLLADTLASWRLSQ